jgi:hypothetical protein
MKNAHGVQYYIVKIVGHTVVRDVPILLLKVDLTVNSTDLLSHGTHDP